MTGILLLALALRFYGIEWDGRGLFHPDERQVLMVVDRLAWPAPGEWHLLLTPASPLNPGFFAYGSFPLYLLKLVSAALAWADPDRLCLVGRGLAALFDTGTVLLVYLLGRRLYGATTGLLAALLTALAVMHVQAAHFYTVDPILAFLVVLTLLLATPVAQRGSRRWGALAGVAWGLALATKANAALLVLPLAVAWGLGTRRAARAALGLGLTLGVALLVFATAEPYALVDAPTFLQHTLGEIAVARGVVVLPYTVQYQGTTPWLTPAWQTTWWGLGLPLGAVAWGGLAFLLLRAWRRDEGAVLLLAWALTYFMAVGGSFAQPMRYMLPLTPVLFIAGSAMLVRAKSHTQWAAPIPNPKSQILVRGAIGTTVVCTLLYALAFVTGVYGRTHPWLTASEWIYRHVPARVVIAVETWEHGLPVEMVLDGQTRLGSEYDLREIDLHGAQDDAARARLAKTLAACDVVVLASRRGYLPLNRQAGEYPLAARFYQGLFRGDLGFQLAAWATTSPALGGVALTDDPIAAAGLPAPAGLVRPPGLTLPLPDESFVVYDHPMPLVFQRVQALPATELARVLEADLARRTHSTPVLGTGVVLVAQLAVLLTVALTVGGVLACYRRWGLLASLRPLAVPLVLFALFGTLDILVTVNGTWGQPAREGNPMARWFIEHGGTVGVCLLSFLWIVGWGLLLTLLYGLMSRLPSRRRWLIEGLRLWVAYGLALGHIGGFLSWVDWVPVVSAFFQDFVRILYQVMPILEDVSPFGDPLYVGLVFGGLATVAHMLVCALGNGEEIG